MVLLKVMLMLCFFKARIFFVETMTFCEIEYRDGIRIDVPCVTKIFKDGSTMISIDGPVFIQYLQCPVITRDSSMIYILINQDKEKKRLKGDDESISP